MLSASSARIPSPKYRSAIALVSILSSTSVDRNQRLRSTRFPDDSPIQSFMSPPATLSTLFILRDQWTLQLTGAQFPPDFFPERMLARRMALRCQHASNTRQFAEAGFTPTPFTKRFNTLFPTQPLPIIADNLLSEAQGLDDDSTMLDALAPSDSRPSFLR